MQKDSRVTQKMQIQTHNDTLTILQARLREWKSH